jgi:hypothetical protein
METGLNGKRKIVSPKRWMQLKNPENYPFFIFQFPFSIDSNPCRLLRGMFVAFREELPGPGSLEGIE